MPKEKRKKYVQKNAKKDEETRSDDFYSNFTLSSYSGHILEHVIFNSGRKSIIKKYSGEESQQWFLLEIFQDIDLIIQHKAGILFIKKIIDKMSYKNNQIIDMVSKFHEKLIFDSNGCSVLAKLFPDMNEHSQQKIANYCFLVFKNYSETKFIELIVTIIQVLPPKHNSLLQLIDISHYLNRPETVNVARNIIEFCEGNVLESIKRTISDNFQVIVSREHLSSLISSLFFRGPYEDRRPLYTSLMPKINDMIYNSFQWRIVYSMISVVPIRDRHPIISAIVGVVISGNKLPHLDQLLRFSIDSIDSQSRIQYMSKLTNVIGDPCFPEYNEYVIGLQYV